MNASAGGTDFIMLRLPPVVGMSEVLKLSLRIIGIQCSEPTLDGLALYVRSISAAISVALGFTVMMARRAGPLRL